MWGISYWIFPIISGLCWLGLLLGLLIHWTSTGEPHYPSMESYQQIAYISDIGAQTLKPLFIAGSCVTTIFLDLSFVSERWLRHRGRLAKNTTRIEKVLSSLRVPPTVHSRLYHLCNFYMLGIPAIRNTLPSTPCSSVLLLYQTRLHPHRNHLRDSFRRSQLQEGHKRCRVLGVGNRLYLHILRLLVLH